jgi:hypothetical protein
MMTWFKLHDEIQHDTKIRRLPIAHRWAFIVLLCMANRSSTRGAIVGLDDEDLAFELEMEKEDWLTLKAKFKVKGLIDFDEQSVRICNWEKRQCGKASDQKEAAKERKRKQRERDRQKELSDVTPMSRDVTRDIYDVTPMSRPCHATDKDRDIEKNRKEGDPEALPPVTSFEFPSPIAELEPEPIAAESPLPPQLTEPISLPIPKSLEQDILIPQFSEDKLKGDEVGLSREAIAPLSHPTVLMEAYLRSGGTSRPWNGDRALRRAFVEYLANTRRRAGEDVDASRGFAMQMVRNADYSRPGEKAYDQISDAWELFSENAARSQSPEQVIGAVTMKRPKNPAVAAWLDARRARQAAEAAEREVSYVAV